MTESGDANLKVKVNTAKINMQGNGNLTIKSMTKKTISSHGGGGSLNNTGLDILK